MDMLEDALQHGSKEEADESVVLSDDTSAEEALAGVSQGTLTLDPSMQYQFRADTSGGQVTYRVVQVGPDGSPGEAQVVGTNAFPPGVAQAVLAQNPFSNGGSPTPEVMAGQDGRFAYVQAGAVAQDAGAQEALAAIGQVTTATDGNGQFYVMMSPQDVLQGQRTIAPRTHDISTRIEGARGGRDERRRATHNEVERRRRDKINNWIVQLSKLVPDCAQECNKAGQVTGSKGGILSKACEYITSLRTANSRMGESLKDLEKLSVDVELLRQQNDELKQENTLLRNTMQQHGLIPPDTGNSSNS